MELNDYELLYLISMGNDSAYASLLGKYTSMIYSIIYKKNFKEFSEYELQEHYHNNVIAFNYAIKGYREDLGVSFSTYLYRCLENRFMNTLRIKRSQNNMINEYGISFDCVEKQKEVYSGIDNNRLFTYEANTILLTKWRKEFVQQHFDSLNLQDRQIVDLRNKGKKHHEIARELDLKESYIQRRLKLIVENAQYSLEKYENN